ncbi:hypothetical protein WDL1P2_00565 (plasmid) [Variovorax sp. WDL1]|nr:hypothetical protein WDL1P2_00565 [Variovorax sp. WDL1]
MNEKVQKLLRSARRSNSFMVGNVSLDGRLGDPASGPGHCSSRLTANVGNLAISEAWSNDWCWLRIQPVDATH